MAGQNYGLPAYLRNNTHEQGSFESHAQFQQRGYDVGYSAPLKNESTGSKEDDARWRNTRYESPSKRQKLDEQTPDVKFVTQTKWKFPESQKWIEVQQTASTQVRNAARASREAENTALLQKRQNESRNGAHAKKSSDTQKSSFGNVEELKDARSASENMRSSLVGHGNALSAIQDQAAETRATSMSINASKDQRHVQHDINIPTFTSYAGNTPLQVYPSLTSVHTVNGIEIGPTYVAPKSMSQADQALSLEKDKDRIAALIAEKRKTNEATMFRQKMLQKQMEHQNEKSVSQQVTDSDEAGNLESSGILSYDIPSDAENNGQIFSLYTIAPQSQSEGIDDRARSSSSKGIRGHHEDSFAVTADTFDGWLPKSRSARAQNPRESRSLQMYDDGTPMGFSAGGFASSTSHEQVYAMNQQNVQTRMHNQQSVVPTNDSMLAPSTKNVTQFSKSSYHNHNRGGAQLSPGGNSSADLTAQIVAATDQIIASSGHAVHNVGPMMSTAINRSGAHIIPPKWMSSAQLHSMQPPGSASISQTTSPANSAQSGPSPPDFQYNMQYQSSMPVKRFQTSAANTHDPSSQWNTTFPQHQVPLPAQSTIATPTFYNINQNFYLGPNQMMQSQQNNFATTVIPQHQLTNFTPSNMSSRPGPDPMQHSQVQTAFTIPQQMHTAPRSLPQPPTLTSNMNMFSGQARASNGNGQRPEPARRERANMFMSRNAATSATMGMEDVRRQIEMT